MAALRAALRTGSRTSHLRTSRILLSAVQGRRTYATPVQRPATDQKSIEAAEQAQEDLGGDEDPNMNGNYPDPSKTSALPIKRQHRDPYGDWWDPIERRNYGEPIHEDNDILGVFSTEDYRHFSPGRAFLLVGCFIGAVGVLSAVVYRYYPDQPAVSRTFEGGLERELGGPLAVRARKDDDDWAPLDRSKV